MKMKWSEFVESCNRTMLDSCKNYEYLAMGLYSEIGEVAGKLKKYIRGDFDYDTLIECVTLEIGDCMWYVAMLDKYCNNGIDDIFAVDLLSDTIPKTVYSSFVEVGRTLQAAELSIPTTGVAVVATDIVTLVTSLERLAASFGLGLVSCGNSVVEKLAGRQEIGTIKGNGDGVER